MKEIDLNKNEVPLKNGNKLVLFSENYSFMEYTYNDITIYLESKLADTSLEVFTVDAIKFEDIILKDSEGVRYAIPKEEIINYKRIINMETIQKDNFKLYCQIPGIGTQKSKIWFVGIEEGGETVSQEDVDKLREEGVALAYNPDNVTAKTQVWDIMARFIYDKYSKDIQMDYKDYRRKMFSREYPYFLSTELLPLPRPNNKTWSEDYEKLFGYKKSDYSKYLSDVFTFRSPIIYENWVKAKPSLTICYGKGYWSEFLTLFRLAGSSFEDLSDGKLRLYPKQNIILSYFFSHRSLRNKEKEILVDLIASL